MEDSPIGVTRAAKLLRVSKPTLQRWDRQGYFVARFRSGPRSHRRYLMSDLRKKAKEMGFEI